MNVFDPHAASHRAIEDRLGAIERDLAIIRTTLEHLDKRLPGRFTQVIAALAILLPMYGVLVSLLWATLHAAR